jgi:transcriptional regulator with XRE-family HTH domain
MKRPPTESAQLRAVLGLNLKLYRVRRGLSQRELAAKAETTATRIGAIERGQTSTTIDLVERLAVSLETEPWRLLLPDEESLKE